jgi:hypothetical protein
MSLLGVAPWMLLSLLLVIALLPVAHSYVLWRRLGNGQPTT